MFYCERCENSFNATVAAASMAVPAVKKDDRVASPLRFRLFEPSALKVARTLPARAGGSLPESQPRSN